MYIRMSPITAEEIDSMRLHSTLETLAKYIAAERGVMETKNNLDGVLFDAVGAAADAEQKKNCYKYAGC